MSDKAIDTLRKRIELYRCTDHGDKHTAEIEACTPYLEKQIEIIKPEALCTLGNYSTGFIMKKYGLEDKIQGISRIHGKVFSTNSLKIIPLYHPAVATYNANMKETLKQDFKVLKMFNIGG